MTTNETTNPVYTVAGSSHGRTFPTHSNGASYTNYNNGSLAGTSNIGQPKIGVIKNGEVDNDPDDDLNNDPDDVYMADLGGSKNAASEAADPSENPSATKYDSALYFCNRTRGSGEIRLNRPNAAIAQKLGAKLQYFKKSGSLYRLDCTEGDCEDDCSCTKCDYNMTLKDVRRRLKFCGCWWCVHIELNNCTSKDKISKTLFKIIGNRYKFIGGMRAILVRKKPDAGIEDNHIDFDEAFSYISDSEISG